LPKPQLNRVLAAEIRAAAEAVRSPTTSIRADSAASAWRRAMAAIAGLSAAPVRADIAAAEFVFCGARRGMG
jgi:hypothetical protein